MKYIKNPTEEINLFEDDSELYELITKYNVIRQKFENGEFKFPPHEHGYIRAFKELYGIEFSMDEMLELREFMVDDAEYWLNQKVAEDFAKSTRVNLDGLL